MIDGLMGAFSLAREATVVIFEETGGWLLQNEYENPTASKTFFNGLDFGRLLGGRRHYAQCLWADAIDSEEEMFSKDKQRVL